MVRSLNKLLDLDLALIEDAYQSFLSNRLQQNERLATLGQVAGGVAHELRNPLNVVKTSVYFLTHARNASDEKRREHLQRIERHVERADGVISALSSFARMPVPSRQSLDIAHLVRETLELETMPSRVEVLIGFPPGFASDPGGRRPASDRLREPGPQRLGRHAAGRPTFDPGAAGEQFGGR